MSDDSMLSVPRDEIVFVIDRWDVQEMARMELGRELDADEMYYARKAVNWGFEAWYEVVSIAVRQAAEEAREHKLGLA